MTRTPWGDPPRLLLACLCLLAACGAARVGGQDAAVLPAPLPAPQPAPQPESQPAPLPAAQPVAQPDALPATQSETAALLAFEQAVVGTKAGLGDGLPGWTPDTNPCSATASWAGVSCTGGSVTSIVLPGAELRGTLPAALNLSKLTVLDLGGNRLEGGLPPTLRLPSLLRLLLGNNQLTGTLPPIWTQNFPRLREMALQGNKLAGTMPPAWTEAAGFGAPFTATVQPSNPLLCGAVTLGANHTLLYSGPASTDAAGGGGDGQSTQHEIITTLGSCAQDGNCGGATVNASAPNLFDLAWGNRVAVLDLEYFNPSVQQNGEPKQGSPVTLPCYPTEPPTFFGSDAAWRKATWQAGSAGNRSSYLPVSGNRQPQGPGNCSLTLDAPGFWMVDLQRETSVMGVLVRAGPEQMQGVDIRVSSEPTPTSGDVCKGGDSYDPGEGKIVLCQRVLQGRYVSISSTSRVSLCVVEVYPVVGNAALGKPTSASAGTGDATQSSQVVNGNMANTACATVVSGTDLSAWITVDLGYEAAVETVVVQNGFSDFLNNDLYIRLGNTPVVVGNENPVCSQGQTLASRNTLPIQCTGPGGGPALGRFLTLYRKINQASDMYICQVLAFLSAGPNNFYQSPPLPPPPPLSPPPAPPPPAPRGAVDITVTDSTVTMLVSMELSGPGLVPLDKAVQDNIVRAASAAWDGNLGMRNVRGVEFEGVNPVSRLSAQAQAQGRALLQGTGAGGGAGPTFNISDSGWVSVQLAVDTSAGQAPDAAQFVAESGYPGGALPAELANEGMDGVVSTIQAISDLGSPPSPAPAPEASPQPGPDPAPAPPAPSPSGAEVTTSSSGAPIGAIVGGVMGGVLVALAAAAALLFVRRRRRRRGGPGPGSEQGDDGGSESPKVGAMEQGLHSSADLLGLPKSGEANGYNLAVAAASGVGYDAASLKLALDGEQLPQGPPVDIISFLADDQGSDHTAMGGQPSDWTDGGLGSAAASTSGVLRTSSDGGLSALVKQKSMASRHDQGVSELWTVDFGELGIEKQIGEGSFGKVYLARWRETTVAVKVLGAMGTGTSPGLDDEFPDAATSKGHPLYESLQKEAAMMASLRHPSIVMYLGVCLDPPAVVTEYCARGSLSDVLKRARSSPLLAAQLDWARRLGMALDAAKGMLYLHSCSPPIIHRDLKSANLLVDKHWRVRVCDFNLSRVMEDSAVLSSVAATNPRWLAPEILSGKGYTFASDVYSFGICMWEMLTWQVPYHEYGPWQVVAMVTESSKRPEVPALSDLPTGTFGGEDEYLSLMCECWAQDPAQRPTFATVISRLRKMLGLETSARRDSPTKSVRSMPPLRTGAPEGGSGGGNGTDDTGTPGSCSHVAASLNGASSELCLSPDRLLSPSPSETEPLVLSGSPGMLSGLNASAGSSPPRPARRSSGSDAPLGLRPLSSRAAGSSRDDAEDAAEAAAAPEAALPPAGSSPAVG